MIDTQTANVATSNHCVCLIYPSPSERVNESVAIRINDIIRMIKPSVKNIYLIVNKDIVGDIIPCETVQFLTTAVCPDARANFFSVIWGELRAQLQISKGLIRLPGQVKILIWKGRSSTFILPIILARVLKKKSILFVESQGSQIINRVHSNRAKSFILSLIYRIIDTVVRSCANKMVVFIPSLLSQLSLTKQKNKVFPYQVIDRFVSADFKLIKPFSQRQMLVGYIGRMSYEKGVLNLAQAIRLTNNQRRDVQFLLGGDGPLLPEIKQELEPLALQNAVNLPGWISYAELPRYLNEMKLLVVPSYYEALPNIVLEAMACGTPVLVTPVGALLDIINDNENGFIMKDNSPECIAGNILRALACQNLETVGANGRLLVDKDYSYGPSCAKWHLILNSIN